MFTLLKKLYRTRLITLPGLYRQVQALLSEGANPMAMLRAAAKLRPNRVAIVDEQERLSYPKLWQQAKALAVALHSNYGIQAKQKVAIACKNHGSTVKAIFAFSRLGAHVFLVNPEMSPEQFRSLEESRRFDFYVYDEPLAEIFAEPEFCAKSLPSYHETDTSIDQLAKRTNSPNSRLKKVKAGNIVVMTGGTTGQPKAASRKPTVLDFLPPFMALLTQIHLDNYRRVYIATPIYHGFGVAAVFVGVMLGTEMYLRRRFEAGQACELIEKNKIEAVTVVPLMLQRILNRDLDALKSLRCVVTGGALLSPALASESLEKLGPTLFNLYGTSEGGFAIMATPDSLARKPESIGKPVRGVRARLVDENDQDVNGNGNAVGRLLVRSSWSTSKKNWIDSGDLAYRDEEGDIFLCGRADDMIVSGGENVYPIELENVLARHASIDSVAVVGIADAEFGQRLKAVIVARENSSLDKASLVEWLKPRVARHQMPAIIEFVTALPYTPLGKVDKKALRQ